ncbi:ketopantoate reductase family protein [Thermodesulfobacteriota bacterium]
MNFLVVGPGAMGCLFAARLKKAGYEVVLLDYNKERAQQINHQGIEVEGVTGKYTEKVLTMAERLPAAPDFVLICVKAYKTRESALSIKPWLGKETSVVTLQNGVGNMDILKEIFGSERVYGGVTAEGATLLGPGKIIHAGQGETIIGPGGERNGPAEKIISALNQAGFKARSVDNVEDLIWGKLIINVGINALTALTRLKNGRLPELDGTRTIMEEAVTEAVSVAKGKNIQLPYPDPITRVQEVCQATAGNIASMLQDVLKERLTEIDFINGAIVREGKSLGIPTPVNLTLTCLVRTVQETYEERV